MIKMNCLVVALLSATATIAEADETQLMNNWLVTTSVSKFDDSRTVTLALNSDEVINCGWNRGAKIRLILRCLEGKTALYFHTGCHMASGSGGYGTVTYRTDKDAAKTIQMIESTDNRSLGLWSTDKAVPVVKELIGKEMLIARMTPYGENSFTASFDVGGLLHAAKPLREACGW